MVPTTFHGISKGIASTTSAADARQPEAGMESARPTPNGISNSSTHAEKMTCLPSASRRSGSVMMLRNHSVPTNTCCVGLMMSCTE